MSAGILPYCGPYILLGYEQHKWSAFAGRPQSFEHPSDTAKREFHEETCNAFSHVDMSKLHMLMETQTPSGQKFFLYGLPFPCRCSLDDFYRNRSRTHSKTHLEKKRLRWFHINHLPRLRPCFENDIDAILQTLNRFTQTSFRAKTATNSMCITYTHVPSAAPPPRL